MGRPKKFSREEVLDKAMPLFWKQGYADTCLQDLEKATGVNKSGLYSEFKDKEDLYLSALRRYVETSDNRQILLEEPLGWHNIEKFLKGKLQACEQSGTKGCFLVSSMRDSELLHPEAAEMMAEGRRRLKQLFFKNIEAEKTRLPTEAVTELLSTFFSGICIEQSLKNSKASLIRKVDDFIAAMKK